MTRLYCQGEPEGPPLRVLIIIATQSILNDELYQAVQDMRFRDAKGEDSELCLTSTE
jgi:hypothetical protein